MSEKGIKMAAEIFSQMQQTRNELMRIATVSGDIASKSAHQDILLSQMFEGGKEAMKNKFCKIIMMKI